jgi:hypothetical protein
MNGPLLHIDRTQEQTLLSRKKKLLFFFLSVFLIYGTLEVISAVVLWMGFGALPLEVARTRETTEGIPTPSPNGALPAHLAVLSLHPYLGYVYDRERSDGFSNHGFTSETVYPKSDDQFVVGIFGGSVADQLFVKRQTLEAELKKIPELGRKKIVFANLAIGGFKQPQQLMTLTYMLSLGAHFDVVINVDGFNEVTLPVNENIPNHVFPFFPRQWHLLTMNTIDPHQAAMIGKIATLQELNTRMSAIFSAFPLRCSFTARLIVGLVQQLIVSRLSQWRLALQQQRSDPSTLRYANRGPDYTVSSSEQTFRDLAEVWAQSSLQMARLCAANGIRYFHFLQPNQYLPNSKAMEEAERQVAYREDQPYQTGVVSGYPYLIEKGKTLSLQGVQFFDLTQIFASHPEPVYGDSCCHFNEHGLEILNTFIGRTVVNVFQHEEQRQ